ncbi:MAG: radical SAM protein [Oscillospiraceae bacterium]
MIIMNKLLENCRLCPRECGVDRYKKSGFCGETAAVRIARAELHYWEEPCISGKNGSGTVFFSGCNLKCCFCQNYEISAENKGFELTERQLADTFLMLKDRGAENINLVSPTHFVPQIINALELCRSELDIPVVYNCGGYEKPETVRLLKGYVDIFLPDLKYFSSEISLEYSRAEDYFERCRETLKVMTEIAGKPVFDENGMMKRGVVVRHLILPSCRHDSIKLMNWLGESFKPDELLVSLMCQYTPVYKAREHHEIDRRVTTFEYRSVMKELEKYGFDGFVQEKSSAQEKFIPEFFDKKYY